MKDIQIVIVSMNEGMLTMGDIVVKPLLKLGKQGYIHCRSVDIDTCDMYAYAVSKVKITEDEAENAVEEHLHG